MPTAPHPPPPPRALRLPPYGSVLPLGPGARLLGLDPATAIAVEDLPPPLADMLDELRDPVGRAELVARAVLRGADAAEAESLLDDLVAAGAVIDAAGTMRQARHRADATIVVVGDGPLSVGIVLGLAHAGVGTVYVETSGTVRVADLGTGYLDTDCGHDRLTATVAALRRLCPGSATGPPPLRLAPDLVVLADAAAPDPERVAELHIAGVAHLSARLRDGAGVVGPLVLPGRTTCLGCLELHRCDRDPGWPAVAAQLVGRRGRADPACAHATAALATAQVLAALDGMSSGGRPPPTLDATLEFDPSAGMLNRRAWTPHPGCGCGASTEHGGMGHGDATCAEGRGQDTIKGWTSSPSDTTPLNPVAPRAHEELP